MKKDDQGAAQRPEDVFRALRDRPTPELRRDDLWAAIEARLEPTANGVVPHGRPDTRPFWAQPRFSGVAASVALVAAALLAWSWARTPDAPARLVVLEPSAAPSAGAGALPGAPVEQPLALEVRLVRGYDGPPPQDVSAAVAAGVGGADALGDARARIATLLPFEEFGIVGAGRGELSPGAPLGVPLSSGYRLVAGTVDVGQQADGTVRLRDVELVGAAAQLANADFVLEPGRLYVLGILPAGTETPTLILLLRIDRSTGSG